MEMFRINMFEFVMSLCGAVDLVTKTLSNHHKRVSYIAASIAGELGLSREDKQNLILAGALHDIGALSLRDRIDTLEFEMLQPHQHAELGYLFLKQAPYFSEAAQLVRHHHRKYNPGTEVEAVEAPLGSHILHLADRIDILIDRQDQILKQVPEVCDRIEKLSGQMFMPELVRAFKSLAKRDSFWFDVVSPFIEKLLHNQAAISEIELDLEGLLKLARLFSRVIDFRSRFTYMHSAGVACCAEALAGYAGYSEERRTLIKIAGFLHDLGKIAVPAEILEKNGKLTDLEFQAIRSHTYYTRRILEDLEGLDTVSMWASSHHERLDGEGYPFRFKAVDITREARIVSIADVFTALSEDRPYRKGMTRGDIVKVMRTKAGRALDAELVSLLEERFDGCNSLIRDAQRSLGAEYRRTMMPLAGWNALPDALSPASD